ncbi:hypothetical protein [Synechococcus sp. CS-197]|uniref:hypothetical protein n=1 Tax=Synechococcus sp. CS-197 TaxID=2847985 RepID=UPI000152560C|nr:hypothetical protein [Synechococcus sp. CS-197]MCT0250224.1 hypothetical protein [Synechococcus sp. CS-197]CAK24761.1 Hypothetical membrane protein [Synechococcus sp. WH 7803]
MHRRLQALRTRHWPIGIAMVLAAVLVLSEPAIVDFFQKGHFNWVSLHSLAIARHSSLANGGVGYSCKWLTSDGSTHLEYFNRYPIVFAVLSRWLLLPWAGDGAAWLYAARQWMNVMFIATALVLWWWLRALRFSRPVAMASLLFTLSAPVVLQYRNMFHFDQPALLAYGLLLLVVVRKVLPDQPDLRWYSAALCLAALSGRSAVVLIASLVLPLQRGLAGRRRGLWLGVPIAFATVGVATAYNIVWEARLNAVSWTSTTVVQSALRRLGLSGNGFSERALERTRWLGGALPKLIAYSTEFMLPLLLVAAVLVLTRLVARRRRLSPAAGPIPPALPEQALTFRRQMLWSTGGTAVLWVVLMKNLFVFHVYAGMVLLPFLLLCMAHTLERLIPELAAALKRSERRVTQCSVVLAGSVLVIVLLLGPSAQLRPVAARRLVLQAFFSDLAAYRSGADAGVPVQRNDQWFPRSPYAQCALLDAPLLNGEPPADAQLSRPPAFPARPD